MSTQTLPRFISLSIELQLQVWDFAAENIEGRADNDLISIKKFFQTPYDYYFVIPATYDLI